MRTLATQAFAIATYTALYLRGHTFARFRDGDEWPAYEIATYAGLAAAASAVSAERVWRRERSPLMVLPMLDDDAAGLSLAGGW